MRKSRLSDSTGVPGRVKVMGFICHVLIVLEPCPLAQLFKLGREWRVPPASFWGVPSFTTQTLGIFTPIYSACPQILSALKIQIAHSAQQEALLGESEFLPGPYTKGKELQGPIQVLSKDVCWGQVRSFILVWVPL